MKLLFIQNMNGLSGSELYLVQILPELKRRGYEVEMLVVFQKFVDNNKFLNLLKKEDIKTYEIYGYHFLSPFFIYKLNKLIIKGNYHIIQSNLIHADLWTALIKLTINPKIKIVSVKHGYDPNYQAKYGYDFRYLKRGSFYWIERFTSHVANYNITISKGLYNVFVDNHISKRSNTKNIYYGLSFKESKSNNVIKVNNDKYVLITGRLIACKGHSYLIKSWLVINKIYPELKLYIAGDGEMRNSLEKEVIDLGLKDIVVFLGYLTDPHPIVESCIFTAVCTNWEGFGLILLESWLHKKPIIAFDAPAMNEIIDDGENGLLTKLNDVEDLASKIIFLYQNPELAKRYGENGYEKLNSYYTLKRMTDETEEVYRLIAP